MGVGVKAIGEYHALRFFPNCIIVNDDVVYYCISHVL